MKQFIYDGSFCGLLTAIFDAYQHKSENAIISREKTTTLVMTENFFVQSEKDKANRVWKSLAKKASVQFCQTLYYVYLSELPEMESVIYSSVRYVFSSGGKAENDYGNQNILKLKQIAQKVGREKHRFEAFVRFSELPDKLFYSSVEPDYNVLPLILSHFKNRFADQDWIIYDRKRKYGIAYNKRTHFVTEIILSDQPAEPSANEELLDEKEKHYRELWKNYFKHTSIHARKNMKLHLQHVPKRYWKYLTEKKR